MAAKNTPAKDASTEEPKAKRKMMTPAERVAKLEAELEAARLRAEKRANKKANQLKERIAVLTEKRDKLNAQLTELQSALDAEVGTAAPETTEG